MGVATHSHGQNSPLLCGLWKVSPIGGTLSLLLCLPLISLQNGHRHAHNISSIPHRPEHVHPLSEWHKSSLRQTFLGLTRTSPVLVLTQSLPKPSLPISPLQVGSRFQPPSSPQPPLTLTPGWMRSLEHTPQVGPLDYPGPPSPDHLLHFFACYPTPLHHLLSPRLPYRVYTLMVPQPHLLPIRDHHRSPRRVHHHPRPLLSPRVLSSRLDLPHAFSPSPTPSAVPLRMPLPPRKGGLHQAHCKLHSK